MYNRPPTAAGGVPPPQRIAPKQESMAAQLASLGFDSEAMGETDAARRGASDWNDGGMSALLGGGASTASFAQRNTSFGGFGTKATAYPAAVQGSDSLVSGGGGYGLGRGSSADDAGSPTVSLETYRDLQRERDELDRKLLSATAAALPTKTTMRLLRADLAKRLAAKDALLSSMLDRLGELPGLPRGTMMEWRNEAAASARETEAAAAAVAAATTVAVKEAATSASSDGLVDLERAPPLALQTEVMLLRVTTAKLCDAASAARAEAARWSDLFREAEGAVAEVAQGPLPRARAEALKRSLARCREVVASAGSGAVGSPAHTDVVPGGAQLLSSLRAMVHKLETALGGTAGHDTALATDASAAAAVGSRRTAAVHGGVNGGPESPTTARTHASPSTPQQPQEQQQTTAVREEAERAHARLRAAEAEAAACREALAAAQTELISVSAAAAVRASQDRSEALELLGGAASSLHDALASFLKRADTAAASSSTSTPTTTPTAANGARGTTRVLQKLLSWNDAPLAAAAASASAASSGSAASDNARARSASDHARAPTHGGPWRTLRLALEDLEASSSSSTSSSTGTSNATSTAGAISAALETADAAVGTARATLLRARIAAAVAGGSRGSTTNGEGSSSAAAGEPSVAAAERALMAAERRVASLRSEYSASMREGVLPPRLLQTTRQQLDAASSAVDDRTATSATSSSTGLLEAVLAAAAAAVEAPKSSSTPTPPSSRRGSREEEAASAAAAKASAEAAASALSSEAARRAAAEAESNTLRAALREAEERAVAAQRAAASSAAADTGAAAAAAAAAAQLAMVSAELETSKAACFIAVEQAAAALSSLQTARAESAAAASAAAAARDEAATAHAALALAQREAEIAREAAASATDAMAAHCVQSEGASNAAIAERERLLAELAVAQEAARDAIFRAEAAEGGAASTASALREAQVAAAAAAVKASVAAREREEALKALAREQFDSVKSAAAAEMAAAGAAAQEAAAALTAELALARSSLATLPHVVERVRASSRGLSASSAHLGADFKRLSADIAAQLAKDGAELGARLAAHASGVVALRARLAHEHAERRRLHNLVQELKGNIRVFARVRPALDTDVEAGSPSVAHFGMPGEVTLTNHKRQTKTWEFDEVFPPAAGNAVVCAETEPLVVSVMDGYNVSIFAYGQTGSGKTYTMEGVEDARGVNYRALESLFAMREARAGDVAYTFSVTMLEIYNENIRDCLAPRPPAGEAPRSLAVREGPAGNYVPDLLVKPVFSLDEVMKLMRAGYRNRSTFATAMNEHSSRSHCMLSVYATGHSRVNGSILRGKLHLVDLAGSERVSRSGATGDRLKEAQAINKSLSALGDVIAARVEKRGHVPFRNSTLTWLLADSLSGDSKVLMFVNVSPVLANAEESFASLNFAARAGAVELGRAARNVTAGAAGGGGTTTTPPAGGARASPSSVAAAAGGGDRRSGGGTPTPFDGRERDEEEEDDDGASRGPLGELDATGTPADSDAATDINDDDRPASVVTTSSSTHGKSGGGAGGAASERLSARQLLSSAVGLTQAPDSGRSSSRSSGGGGEGSISSASGIPKARPSGGGNTPTALPTAAAGGRRRAP